MSTEITTAMQLEFGTNIDLLQQQLESLFRPRVRLEMITSAETLELDQVDAVEMDDIETRHQDTNLTTVPHRKRNITPIPASVAVLESGLALRVFRVGHRASVSRLSASALTRGSLSPGSPGIPSASTSVCSMAPGSAVRMFMNCR